MFGRIKEKDIQNYLYRNLEELPSWIWLNNLKIQYQLNREDLIFHPLKYLLNKKYHHVFEKMSYFSEHLHKFSKEFVTAELWKSKPRMDILAYHEDPCTFYIVEVKWDKNPERQTLTELLQYANWLQNNDFPWLPNDDIVFVVVAQEWSNILIQSVVNAIAFKGLNILPIEVKWKNIKNLSFTFFDLWNVWVLENLDQQIYNEENYPVRMITFDEFQPGVQNGILKSDYNDIQTITMSAAVELSRSSIMGYILWMEYDGNSVFKNAIAMLFFNPMSLWTKNWDIFTNNKSQEMDIFSRENEYFPNMDVLRRNIEFHYPKNNISYEEWDEWISFSWLNSRGWRFSYGYPIGFLEILIRDLVSYCREDKDFAYKIVETDDVDWRDQISHWMYLDALFRIKKSNTNSIEEYVTQEFALDNSDL